MARQMKQSGGASKLRQVGARMAARAPIDRAEEPPVTPIGNDIARGAVVGGRKDGLPGSTARPAQEQSGSMLTIPRWPARGSARRAYGLGALKIALAAMAVGLVGTVALWPQLQDDGTLFSVDGSPLLDAQPGMTNARYVGTDRENRPVSIRAKAVQASGVGEDQVMLDRPEAEMTLEGGEWIFVTAQRGRYDLEEKYLELNGDVKVFHDAGYEFESSEANVDLEVNVVYGDKPVHVQGPAGLISATGFRILNDGDTVFFSGPAKMTIFAKEPSKRRGEI